MLAVVLAVDLLERPRPGFTLDRRRELPLNVAAILLTVFAGEWVKKLALAVVLTDFSLYWVHREMHNPRLLWFTHVFHHSIGDI